MLNYNEKEIEQNIQYVFNDKSLLKQALSHSSFINEMKKTGMESYERLEFLGDAVLKLVISNFLYQKYLQILLQQVHKSKIKCI